MKFLKTDSTPNISTNVVFNFFGQVLTLAAALVCMPFFIRLLGNDRVGILSIIWVIVGYLSILDFGMGLAVTKMVSTAISKGENERVSLLFWNALFIQAVFGIIGGCLLIFSTSSIVTKLLKIPPDLLGEAKLSFILAGIAFPVVICSSSISGLIQAIRRFDLTAMNQTLAGVAQFSLPLIVVIFIKRLPVAVFAILLIRIASVLVLFLFSVRLIPDIKQRWKISFADIRCLLKFGGWVTVSSIVSPLLVYADRFFLGHLLPVSSVAFYAIPLDAVVRLLIIPRSLMAVLFPVFSGMATEKKNERINELFFRALKYIGTLVGILIPIFILNSRDALQVWVGNEYANQGTTALQILFVGILSCSISLIPYTLLQAVGRADVPAKIHLAEFPIFIGLSYFLIAHYGIVGAAVAWTTRLVVEMFILFACSHSIARVRISQQGKKMILKISIMFVGILILGKMIIVVADTLPVRVLGSIILGLVSLFFAWKKTFSQQDRQMFKILITKGKNYVISQRKNAIPSLQD